MAAEGNTLQSRPKRPIIFGMNIPTNEPTASMKKLLVDYERKIRQAERGAIVAYLRHWGMAVSADAIEAGAHVAQFDRSVSPDTFRQADDPRQLRIIDVIDVRD